MDKVRKDMKQFKEFIESSKLPKFETKINGLADKLADLRPFTDDLNKKQNQLRINIIDLNRTLQYRRNKLPLMKSIQNYDYITKI